MSAKQSTRDLQNRIERRCGVLLGFDDANTLRRAQLTLHRWAELECGDGHGLIERNDVTGHPYYYRMNHSYVDPHDPRARYRIPDREAGALRRVAGICERNGLHYYLQTDPRGCVLYVSNEPFPENDYTRGIACCD